MRGQLHTESERQRVTCLDRLCRAAVLLGMLVSCSIVDAATVTVSTNRIGPAPAILAYNSGHFFPGSNTRDWWRYSGVNGARLFISPSEIEFSDDVAPVGDNVTSSTLFLNRRAEIRTNQFGVGANGLPYVDWSAFASRYESNDLYPNNHIRVNYAIGEMRKLGIAPCVQITTSQSRLPISSNTDWPNMWELWQHFYAQVFYLARYHDVQRFQMFNEPNHPNANGLTLTNFLIRLQLASDAMQCAVEGVNRIYGKSLVARMLAPVTSGSAESSFADWGEIVVTNRHVNFLGQTDPGFNLLQVYDYHQYGSTPATFGSSLASLHATLTAAMAPEPRYPTAISEFNTRTGASFDDVDDTLDYPTEYARFGAICANLVANGCDELYCFKFSQTEASSSTANFPVQKNAMHYLDNYTSPYNVGGITKAGEVWRLFNKAFSAGGGRIGVVKGTGATGLDVQACGDPASGRVSFFSANNTTTPVALNVSLASWNIPSNNLVLLEEVSETCYGAVRLWTNAGPSGTVSSTQNSNTVWLLTASTVPQAPELVVPVSDDTEVRDGSNKVNVYGANLSMTVRNDPAAAANRSVAFLKFQVPATNDMETLQFALLSMSASSTTNAVAQAHLYGLQSAEWSEATLAWNNAPNLRDNVPAGNRITNNVVEDPGGTAQIHGQVVVNSTNVSEMLIDVTKFVRTSTNNSVVFMVSQDPRWNTRLPGLDAGDTQAAGVRITSKEGAAAGLPGPRLRLVFSAQTNPPFALNDAYSAPKNMQLAVPAPGVLTNDQSTDGGPLRALLAADATNGVVSLAQDGAFTYTPESGYFGPDSFLYVAASSATSAPALVSIDVTPTISISRGIAAWAEAFVRGGTYSDSNPDEAGTGYLMVKYSTTSSLDFSRKAFFQFNVSGQNLEAATDATLRVGFTDPAKQSVQLWALKQAWPGFNFDITWNTAQANELRSNDLLLSGNFTAEKIGSPVLLPLSSTNAYSFEVANPSRFAFNDGLTFALTGVSNAGNDAAGLRIQRNGAVLSFTANLPAGGVAPVITSASRGVGGGIEIDFNGTPGAVYVIEAATNLVAAVWRPVSTNVASSDGSWSFTDDAELPTRFYRGIAP